VIERLLAAEAALGDGRLDAAERLFEQVRASDPRNAIAVVGLARVARLRTDPEAAAALVAEALAIDPDEAAAQRLAEELSVGTAREPATAQGVGEPATAEARRSWWVRLFDWLRGRGTSSG
jgi:uncharacterized protein HemY